MLHGSWKLQATWSGSQCSDAFCNRRVAGRRWARLDPGSRFEVELQSAQNEDGVASKLCERTGQTLVQQA